LNSLSDPNLKLGKGNKKNYTMRKANRLLIARIIIIVVVVVVVVVVSISYTGIVQE